MNFLSVITHFFVQGMMPQVKDLPASDLDDIMNELLEECQWTPLLAAREQQHHPHTRK